MRLSSSGHVALVASISQHSFEQPGLASQENREYSFQATYYPTTMLGITAGLSLNRGDDHFGAGETYAAGVRTFLTPALSLSLDYRKFNARAASNDGDTIALRAAMRF